MRNEDKLKIALKSLVETQDETFRVYRDRKVVGNLVFKALMSKRAGVSADDKKLEGYYLTSKDNEVGLMSQLYGLTGLLSLVNRYGVVPTDEEKKKIKSGVKWVLEYIEKNGYDLSPYLDKKINEDFFQHSDKVKGLDVSYIGARTWAFSMFVSARKAHLNKSIDFSAEMDQIKDRIKKNIKFFVKTVIRYADEPLGYGYANGCEDPSLFFTYSVVEAFADFDDLILGGENKTARDDELLEYINQDAKSDLSEQDLSEQFEDICFKLGDRAWNIFGRGKRGNILKSNLFSDRFDDNFHIITAEEIMNSSRSSALFNTLYVIFILFYSYKNLRGESDEENIEIKKSMSLGLQFIQNFYDELSAIEKDSIVDRHIIAFDQKHKFERFSKELNDATILASTLLPMLAKANNLIAFHVHKFPQQKMGELFDQMLSSKLDDNWLWENRKYDLLSTERYLEAIADFYDYYDKFERQYAEKSISDEELRVKLSEEVRKTMEPMIAKEQSRKINEKHKKEMETVFNEAANRYPIETQLNQRIENNINGRTLTLICDALDTLSKYNRLSEEDRQTVVLSGDEQKLRDSLCNYFESNFAHSFKIAATNANLNTDVEKIKLKEAGEIDFHQTVTAFFEFIAEHNLNRQGPNKLSLKEVFKYIENNKEK